MVGQTPAVLLLDDAARQREPDPQPPALVDTPGSNRRPRISGDSPGPSSRTLRRAAAPSVSTITSMRPPRPESASMAFLITASRAHSTSTGSPSAVGPGPVATSASVTGLASVGMRGRK